MILRTFFAKHQDDVIETVENEGTISLEGLDDWSKGEWFASPWLDAEVEDRESVMVIRESVSCSVVGRGLVHYQVSRSPTIEELEAEITKLCSAQLAIG